MQSTIFDIVREVIDLRSFSNIWYWITLASFWSAMSYFVLGVPSDMIQRAAREGGQAAEDVVTLARISILRTIHLAGQYRLIAAFVVPFFLSLMLILALFYGHELSQALLLLLLPAALVAVLTHRRCQAIMRENPDFDGLMRHLRRQRFITQLIGMISMSIAVMWGMWVNFYRLPWF